MFTSNENELWPCKITGMDIVSGRIHYSKWQRGGSYWDTTDSLSQGCSQHNTKWNTYVSCPLNLACFRTVGAGEAQFAGLHLRVSSLAWWGWCSRVRVSSKFPGASDAVPSACFGTIGSMTKYHCPVKKKSGFRRLSELVYQPGHGEVWSGMFSFHAYGCCYSGYHNLTLPSKVRRTDQEAKNVVWRHLKPITRISPIWCNLTGWGSY